MISFVFFNIFMWQNYIMNEVCIAVKFHSNNYCNCSSAFNIHQCHTSLKIFTNTKSCLNNELISHSAAYSLSESWFHLVTTVIKQQHLEWYAKLVFYSWDGARLAQQRSCSKNNTIAQKNWHVFCLPTYHQLTQVVQFE